MYTPQFIYMFSTSQFSTSQLCTWDNNLVFYQVAIT